MDRATALGAMGSTADLALTEYGLIGDCRTAALVSREGSVDWWCAPRFDSPSLFARLIDHRQGGHFAVRVRDAAATLAYEDGTNILRRQWSGAGGEATHWDFMAWPMPGGIVASRIVRLLQGTHGALDVEVEMAPRPDYARAVPTFEEVPTGLLARGGGATLLLGADRPLIADHEGARVLSRFTLREGERAAFVLRFEPGFSVADPPRVEHAWEWFETSLREWRVWDARTHYEGPYREAVRRSALVLKLLTHEPSGAILAAPTTSLPEGIGGIRNWDYRYVWLRDAWLLADALYRVGHPNQASGLLRWLLETCSRKAPELRILYGVRPDTDLTERTLDHLAGWRGSRPVRTGNAAHDQLQLDVYGQLLGALHACRLLGRDVQSQAWPFLREVVDFVADNWRRPDCGMWEFRATPRHFVHSKVLAWVALDRGVAAVEEAGLEGDAAQWREEAAALRAEVLAKGWDDEVGAFVQSYGSKSVDAANLLLPLVNFLPANDPRCVATVRAVQRDLSVGPYVYRYRGDDGLPGDEGAFVYCSFWLVDNLVLQGRLGEARGCFDSLMQRAGPLGLLAEEIDPHSGELLGNYPQGFSHIGLIRSALLLADAERLAARARAGQLGT